MTKDVLLSWMASPLKIESLLVDGLGEVHAREMSGAERDAFDRSIVGDGDGIDARNYRAKLVAACVCDSAGQLLFMPAHADQIGKCGSVALQQIFALCQRVNGMGAAARDELKKNGTTATSEDSGSSLPA